MGDMLPKAKQWIEEKKDPRSACWQAGLEAVMELFMPDLEKGKLVPVAPLEDRDLSLFQAALSKVDLSPGLLAAFLPPSVAKTIAPPDSVEQWIRIDKAMPSYKIIIMRTGKESRILCAEISEHAHKPGVDIFHSGVFLGNFDYETSDVCISELSKIVRAHAWEKDKWQPRDYLNYTINWFERSAYLGKSDIIVDQNYSFFHSPSLVKANRIDALFMLLYEVLIHRFRSNPQYLDDVFDNMGKEFEEGALDTSPYESIAETYLLDLLNTVRELNLVDFSAFNDRENREFKNEFVRTVRKLSSDIHGKTFA